MRRTVYMKKQYDYLLVGSGLFAGVFAYYAKKPERPASFPEKRGHAGGNIYCENIEGINVHRYGAHIFHTSNKEVWNFVNSLVEFKPLHKQPGCELQGRDVQHAVQYEHLQPHVGNLHSGGGKKIINEQRKVIKGEPKNLEEQAISLVGNPHLPEACQGLH